MALNPNITRDLRGASIDQFIAQHGVWTVLRAALRAMLRPAPRPLIVTPDLSNHLRRDIGLAPVARSIRYGVIHM